MNWQGWLFICFAWGFVGGIFFYSFYRILIGKRTLPKKTKNLPGERD